MATENERPEERLERMLDGAAADEPTPEDEAALRMAETLRLEARATPPPVRQDSALLALMANLEAQRLQPAPAGWRGMLSALGARPAMRTVLAVVAALTVVSGGLGVAAAGGSEPVRGFLRISADSVIKVEFEGTVIGIAGDALTLDAAGQIRTVLVDAETSIKRGGDAVPLENIALDEVVEVHGKLLEDNSVLATRIQIEDEGASPTAPAPGVSATPEPTTAPPTAPAGQPTVDDDDGDDDRDDGDGDNSGPGHDGDDAPDGDDGHDGGDNSGPGSQNSGPGDGGDDDGDGDDGRPDDDGADDGGADDDDNSGPGGGDDGQAGGDDDDDNSGPGGGGDDD